MWITELNRKIIKQLTNKQLPNTRAKGQKSQQN